MDYEADDDTGMNLADVLLALGQPSTKKVILVKAAIFLSFYS